MAKKINSILKKLSTFHPSSTSTKTFLPHMGMTQIVVKPTSMIRCFKIEIRILLFSQQFLSAPNWTSENIIAWVNSRRC